MLKGGDVLAVSWLLRVAPGSSIAPMATLYPSSFPPLRFRSLLAAAKAGRHAGRQAGRQEMSNSWFLSCSFASCGPAGA